MLLYLCLFAGLTAALASVLTYGAVVRDTASDRFARYAGAVPAADRREPWHDAIVKPLAPLLERMLPGHYLDAIRAELRRAGWTGQAHFQLYLVIQSALGLAGVLAGAGFGGHQALLLAVALGFAGFLMPAIAIRRRVRARQKAIDRSLPDSLDLLTACVEAGLGLDMAIAQLVRRRSPRTEAVNEELNRYLRELQLGVGRSEALRNLGTRSGVEDLKQVVTALMHGDALGVGVSQVLRAQCKHLRLRRKQRAEEQAMKAPVKILFPLLFGIFPSIFVIILGPAALRLMDTFVGKF